MSKRRSHKNTRRLTALERTQEYMVWLNNSNRFLRQNEFDYVEAMLKAHARRALRRKARRA